MSGGVREHLLIPLHREASPQDSGSWFVSSDHPIACGHCDQNGSFDNMLEEKKPDAPDSVVVLIGSGSDRVYRELLRPYQEIIRVGLARRGKINFFCDICSLPISDNQTDLIFSSSVP